MNATYTAMRFVDPDGMKVRAAGDSTYNQQVLDDYRKLTNDQLAIDDNGQISISKKGGDQ